MLRFYRPLLILAILLAFGVISLGAYVRLSDAGLGCPDWPGCYGHWLGVPETAHEQSTALNSFPGKPVEAHKAWKEMVHRYFAGLLGLLIALITGLSWRYRRALNQSPVLPSLLLAVVGLQALLGMWTVTRLLKPVIVSAHLLGGMSTLALLVWLLLKQERIPELRASPGGLRLVAFFALAAIIVQIVLGGWVSSNYAALACGDFPTCLGHWIPEMDFARAFQLHQEPGQAADGASLPLNALSTIQWTHRIGALIVALSSGTLAWRLLRRPDWRDWGLLTATALFVQLGLGIANILFSLPLPVAVAHNAGAAFLLSITLALNFRLWSRASQI